MIIPRSIVEQGFVDVDREDYNDDLRDGRLKGLQLMQLAAVKNFWTADG